MPSSIRSAWCRRRILRSCIPRATASPRPTTTARSSSTGCSGSNWASINEMMPILRRTYCDTIGYEFVHMSDPVEKAWMQARIEGPDKAITFTPEGKRAILNKLIEAEGFEKFLDVRYTGTKRFGLDGGESMVPALEQIIKRGGALGIEDIEIGMAHRGRLNVLSQVMHKPHRAIFHEFKGGSATPDTTEGSGDVKYHLGFSSDRTPSTTRRVHLSLAANPFASRDRRSRRAGQGARQAGSERRFRRALQGPAAAAARRRGLRRPGRHRRMFRPLRPEGSSTPAARSTSSSTTRSASRPIRATRAPRPIRPTRRR